MSRSLSIECEWLDQPCATDRLERQTWASIRISAAGRTVTRLWDRQTQDERATICIPAFPLARWIVTNWWALLYEPSRSEQVLPPRRDVVAAHRDWLYRHCLRSAEAGLMLPRMCLFSDGYHVCVQWWADDQDAYSHMPGYFVDSGLVCIDRGAVEHALREFVSNVLARARSTGDERAARLQANWTAITSSDSDESAFCRAAGRMGLDPYESDSWNPEVVSLLETGIGEDSETPLVEDFLEAADATSAVRVWGWVRDAGAALHLQRAPKPLDISIRMPTFRSPADSGYHVAQVVRKVAGLDSGASVADVDRLAEPLGIKAFSFKVHNHLPVAWVRAAVGWQAGGTAVIAGPRPTRPDSLRFLQARGLYHAAFACDRGARLVTAAHTWDQKAARAFAAELLAPGEALVARAQPDMSADDLIALADSLAKEYLVSTKLIWHQWENNGIGIAE